MLIQQISEPVDLSGLAEKMVATQEFEFENFKEAKCRLIFRYNEQEYFVEFDRITLFKYVTNLSDDDYRSVFRALYSPLTMKLDNPKKKYLSEYHALRFFIDVCNLDYLVISKAQHPDFIVKDAQGRSIGIEVVQLTTYLNQLQNSLHMKYVGNPYDDVRSDLNKELGKNAKYFDIKSLGNSFALLRKNCSSLSLELKHNADQLNNKYKKYNEKHKLIEKFDEFIVLGDALSSEVAIKSDNDVDEILHHLRGTSIMPNVSFVILYQNHDDGKVSCKGIESTLGVMLDLHE